MTVKNPDADASEWHAPNARSDTPRTQGVSPLTRSGHLRHRLRAAGTLTLAGPGPRVCLRVVMSTLPIRTRRWTRRESARLAELGVLNADEPIELVDGAPPPGSQSWRTHWSTLSAPAEVAEKA